MRTITESQVAALLAMTAEVDALEKEWAENGQTEEALALLYRARDAMADVVTLAEPAEPLRVIIAGNPLDGFRYCGPFADADAAVRYGDRLEPDWWLAQLDEPDE